MLDGTGYGEVRFFWDEWSLGFVSGWFLVTVGFSRDV